MRFLRLLRFVPRGGAASLYVWLLVAALGAAERRPNILLFTADDLGSGEVGLSCMGGKVPALTPQIDRFAGTAVRFANAHVNGAICVPSRANIATGRFGFSSGVYGFKHAHPDVPLLMELLQGAGYFTGILSKVAHSTVKPTFKWDYSRDADQLGRGRSPSLYEKSAGEFFRMSRDKGQPFYLMVNSDDPHRPYQYRENLSGGAEPPSRWYSAEEVVVPSYLPDLPNVRQELAAYFNSTRRLDDTFGKVMSALEAADLVSSTVVIFLSDNGIAMPFAKANCYLASTRTPLLVRWPGITPEGGGERREFVSGVDLMPTLLEGVGLALPARLSGRSFAPLLRGERQENRDSVFTQIDYKIAGEATPMRAIQDDAFGYIFNPWSGALRYANNNEGQTMRAMEAVAGSDVNVRARVEMFRRRATEELYDLRSDPGCLINLIDEPAFARYADVYREKLRAEMAASGDPLLETFLARGDTARMQAAMEACYRHKLPPGSLNGSK